VRPDSFVADAAFLREDSDLRLVAVPVPVPEGRAWLGGTELLSTGAAAVVAETAAAGGGGADADAAPAVICMRLSGAAMGASFDFDLNFGGDFAVVRAPARPRRPLLTLPPCARDTGEAREVAKECGADAGAGAGAAVEGGMGTR